MAGKPFKPTLPYAFSNKNRKASPGISVLAPISIRAENCEASTQLDRQFRIQTRWGPPGSRAPDKDVAYQVFENEAQLPTRSPSHIGSRWQKSHKCKADRSGR